MDNENNTLFVMPTTNANAEHTNKDSHEDVAHMMGPRSWVVPLNLYFIIEIEMMKGMKCHHELMKILCKQSEFQTTKGIASRIFVNLNS